MRPNVGAFLAPAAQLNEMAAQGLSQAAKFWEQIGQAALADLLWEQAWHHRSQAIRLRALEDASNP